MNKEIWLWILLVMLPYNERTMKIFERYGDVRSAAEAMRDGSCDMLTDEERERAKNIRSREVNSLIADCEANDIRIVTIEDEEYPKLLREICVPPVVLFVRGSLENMDEGAVLAVVGSRECSAYSIEATRRICTELAELGVAIVSGLAVGIDCTAHRSALDGGSKTIGVLACGHLVDYPTASRQIKQDIIKSGGAVISELLPRTGVDKDYFHHRNRIISGLAHGLFIAEAGEISGCHHTAGHATEQGRELFCLPPYNVFSPQCSGVNRYLRDGATPVFGSVDIVNGLKYRIFGVVE